MLTAVFRAFGPELAELPLIATQAAERRKGHCKVFVGALQKLLAETGVKSLSLPAAHSTVRLPHTMWVIIMGMCLRLFAA